MVCQLRLEAASQLRAAEHQAERLRIEIVSLREQLDQGAGSQLELQRTLEREQEERGELTERRMRCKDYVEIQSKGGEQNSESACIAASLKTTTACRLAIGGCILGI